MNVQISQDTLDDDPDKAEADGFDGFDAVTEPTKLKPSAIRAGENMWMDVDLLLQTRPGLQFNTLLSRLALGGGSHVPRGMGYYDILGFERVLVAADGKLLEIQGDGNNVTSSVLTPTPSASVDVRFAQLVDRMFWCDGVLNWSINSAGWTHGSVTTFSDASAMPTWSLICAHDFRLLALDPATGKIYASAIGAANAAGNWVKTENFRVGTGEGDPPVEIISAQAGRLIVVCERSAWNVDTSNASVALWRATRITNLTGCREGKTAKQVGQDVIFLSGFGIVSLGSLADNISVNPQTSISAPIQPYIDRINAAAVSSAWATIWRDHYIIALPLDSATVPNIFLGFNLSTRRWTTPWKSVLPTLDLGGGNTIAFAGFVAGVVTNFSGSQETLIADNTGRVLRLDKTFEKDASSAMVTQEIVSWATSKAFTHDMPETLKQPFIAQAEWFGSTASGVQLNLVRDGLKTYPDKALNLCEIIAAGLATNAQQTFPIIFPFQFQSSAVYPRSFNIRNYGRYRNAGIQAVSQQGRMKLRVVRLFAFIDALPLV